MRGRWLALFANAFVGGCALDATLSLAEEILRASTGSTLLLAARNALALPVVAAAALCLPLLALTPRLPTLPLLALSLGVLWLNLGAAPLPLLVGSTAGLGLVTASLQVAFVAAALLWMRQRAAGRGWLLTEQSLTGPALSLRHTLGFAAGSVFLLLPAAFLYLLVSIATWLQLATQSFVSFDAVGVSLSDRLYARDGREIRLIGMMHIGEGEAYRELVSSFVGESTIVLEEGVSDAGGALEQPLSYERAARVLGLEPQGDLEQYLEEVAPDTPRRWPTLRRADVDVSDFSPLTVQWLTWAGKVWSSDDPLAALLRFVHRSSQKVEELEIVERDIIQLRNEHLLGEIDRALEDYERVVVPWGALHLPFIERAILERGFDPTHTTRHRLISWLGVAAALR
jgi:hypothetical protein